MSAAHVAGGLEDAVFAFAGVDEEPDLLDEVFDGDAFGDAFFAACGFASLAVGLAAGVADGFVVVAVAFDGCCGSAWLRGFGFTGCTGFFGRWSAGVTDGAGFVVAGVPSP